MVAQQRHNQGIGAGARQVRADEDDGVDRDARAVGHVTDARDDRTRRAPLGFARRVLEPRADRGHEEDMGLLNSRRSEVGGAANTALGSELSAEQAHQVKELLETCERVLRRRRILRE